MKAYDKEIKSTIWFAVIYVVLGHTGLFAILIGTNNDTRILGFPAHYFIALILGSVGILIVSVFWASFANKLEDEIEAENSALQEDAK